MSISVQLLLAKSALARVEPRLKALAPDLELTLVTPAGTFERNGKEIPADQVDPDVAWLSLDAMRDGYLPAVLGCLAKSTKTKWMQSFLAGLDHPAFKQIIGKGIRLSKSSAQAIPIAEYVTGHAFSLLLPIEQQRAAQAKTRMDAHALSRDRRDALDGHRLRRDRARDRQARQTFRRAPHRRAAPVRRSRACGCGDPAGRCRQGAARDRRGRARLRAERRDARPRQRRLLREDEERRHPDQHRARRADQFRRAEAWPRPRPAAPRGARRVRAGAAAD